MENKESLLEIRKLIPIGINAAKNLLEKENFDINKAVVKWKSDQVNILAIKISVKPEEAKELLDFVKYDFAKALSIYRDRNTTIVEKILASSKKEEQVLANFWVYISQKLGEHEKYGEWIHQEGFKQLPEIIRDILTIWQWYAYYGYEGISVEQSITSDVIQILRTKLGFQEFAEELKVLKEMIDKFYKENPYDENNLEKSITLRNQFISSKDYIALDRKIMLNEELIMKQLFNYLYSNSDEINELIEIRFK